jgi:hypothetical protein
MKAWSTRDAAEELGISVQRIRVLAGAGRLSAHKVGGRWIVEEVSRAREPRAGRPLSSTAGWAILAELSGARVSWMQASALSRLRRRMREGEWVIDSLLHGDPRSRLVRWRALPSDLAKMAIEASLIPTGLSAVTGDIDLVAASAELDAYVSRRTLGLIERRFQPAKETEEPNITLRVPDLPWILTLSRAPLAVVAADLLRHPDPRVSRAGGDALRGLLNGRSA